MGYDMYWRRTDDADVEQSYFQLNGYGMGRYVDLMYELGMVFDDDEHPAWPKPEDFGTTYDMVEIIDYPEDTSGTVLTGDQRASAEKYIAERDRVRAWHGREVPGISAHKFGGGGWIVTPVECESALRIYMAKLEEIGQDAVASLVETRTEDVSYWAEWLHYIRGAVKHDGFQVR